jgi:hypothetical protein
MQLLRNFGMPLRSQANIHNNHPKLRMLTIGVDEHPYDETN